MLRKNSTTFGEFREGSGCFQRATSAGCESTRQTATAINPKLSDYRFSELQMATIALFAARPNGLAGLRSGSGLEHRKHWLWNKTKGDTSHEVNQGTLLKWVGK